MKCSNPEVAHVSSVHSLLPKLLIWMWRNETLPCAQQKWRFWSEGTLRASATLAFLFFKYKFIYFNWRLITLQYCIVLYCIVLVLPYINMNPPQVYTCSPFWTPLPPPSPYHPSGSSQCTSPKHPVSCIEPEPAIRFTYDIIHVSMPFSQIIKHVIETANLHISISYEVINYKLYITYKQSYLTLK